MDTMIHVLTEISPLVDEKSNSKLFSYLLFG